MFCVETVCTCLIKNILSYIILQTLYTMERLHDISSQPPQTPHEEWFQDTYGELIEEALGRLRDPPNPSHPQQSWALFKQVSMLENLYVDIF